MSIYGEYKPTLQKILQELMTRFNSLNQEQQSNTGDSLFEHLNGRVKTEKSMTEKCQRKNLPLTPYSALRENRDSIGLRIVCNFIDDIYLCVDKINQMPDIEIVKKKDYITNAKPNGYRSYHLILDMTTSDIDIEGNSPGHYYVEIQLRTIAMDTWASLEHEMKYKHEVKHPELISRELKRVADELASCDVSMQTIRQMIRDENQ
ncbi:GTP pyrophosphokinase family protein [Lactobacillus sp. LL6]|uniref:GTP pyrophosphokinase n=1 Tax=Lactobacillus sp. LL6 TaxID=2596827 RepID=UPI001185E7BC|nr:GTP pyrophosphokinase family protein [Lactobacillus sp. LL6]TSO25394.1 GTP pyrophosphokinase family protein [Lactobacillus sp. LL6]